jgi:phosphoglucosamine mutase
MDLPQKKLFGTDGVRGVAGELLTAELAVALGIAATRECKAPRPQVLVLRDTRESGPMLESAIAAGIAQAGGDALIAGVLPTPAASILVRRLGLDLAAVISASHNPWHDNGIKFFGGDGHKLGDEAEARIEEVVRGGVPPLPDAKASGVGTVRELHGGLDDYLRELERAFRLDLSGRRIVIDCANGSTHRAGPAIFTRLGADIDAMATEPDGHNINADCGSTHPEALAARVVELGAEIGFAFDGDGDRVIAVDGEGNVRDGDEMIALHALHLAKTEQLAGGVAVTVMSNYGFHNAMESAGIEVATTAVGDRAVSAEMDARNWTLGGEQSGHVIWTEFAPTGDGIAAALLTLAALGDEKLLAAKPMTRLPQVLVNVEVADRDSAAESPKLAAAVERESAELEGRGRVLVRPSGTEPLIRVMVEAPEASEAEAVCERLVAIVRA